MSLFVVDLFDGKHVFSISRVGKEYHILGTYKMESYEMVLKSLFEIDFVDTNLNDEDVAKVRLNLLKQIFHDNFKGVDVIE